MQTLLREHSPEIALKWPNDVLLNNAKFAGILLEAQTLPDGNRAVVVGMGLNIVNKPTDVPYATIALNDIKSGMSASDVLATLSHNWLQTFSLWDYGNGTKQILDQWRTLAHGVGQPIKVVRTKDTIKGTFHSIDDQGRLLVVQNNGQTEIISAGDVYF